MKKIGLIVGHTVKDKGAYSAHLGVSEFDYWKEVANKLATNLRAAKIECFLFLHEPNVDYHQRQSIAAVKANALKLDMAIELHFNAASPLANGTETLYWFGSKKGKKIAQDFSYCISKLFGTKIRGDKGAKALVNKNDRGYQFVYLQKAPAVVLEPFFGSNKEDCEKFKDKIQVAHTLAQIIELVIAENYE